MIYPLLAPYAIAKNFMNAWLDHVFYDLPETGREEDQCGPADRKFKQENKPPTAFVSAGAVSSGLRGVSLARNAGNLWSSSSAPGS
jgi:hypothetical protein